MIIGLTNDDDREVIQVAKENNPFVSLAIAFWILLVALGCGETETRVEVPTIKTKVVGKGRDLVEIPYLLISVTNVGRTEARIVDVDVYVQKNGDIVDATEFSVWYLRPGETEVESAKLFNLYSHDDYDSIELNARVVTF